MQRRSNATSGWVRFPVDDPAWKSSGEGGMLVKLVVCDNREFGEQFGVCLASVVCRSRHRDRDSLTEVRSIGRSP